MSSFFTSSKMKLNQEKIITEAEEWGFGYNFDPKQELWMEGCEEFYTQPGFSWSSESVIVAKEDNVIKYTKTDFINMKAVDEDGNELLICGMTAPYEGCDLDEKHKNIHYVFDGDNEGIPAYDFKVEVFDTKTLKKKIYKMKEVEEKEMSDYEIKEYLDKSN